MVIPERYPVSIDRKRALASRLRQIREATFGVGGVPDLASRLGLPARTWLNYESGVTVPGEVMLRFLVLTAAEPAWLLEGCGPRFREDAPSQDEPAGASVPNRAHTSA
jgi:hypothetical protein